MEALNKEKRDKGARALGKAVGEHSGREKVVPSAKRRKEERESILPPRVATKVTRRPCWKGRWWAPKALLTQRETIQALVEKVTELERAMKGVKEKEAPEKGT